jgi:cellobiose phosphorylase
MPETLNGLTGTSLSSPSGLRAEFNANGSLRRLDCDAVSLLLFIGNEIDGGPTNVYLRSHADAIEWTALLGPQSPTRFGTDPASGRLAGTGVWCGINYSISLVLAQSVCAWFWHIRLENSSSVSRDVDLTYAQDLALAPYGAIRLNEFYVSQYLDHSPLTHADRGVVMASRQNQAVDGRYPWTLIGSLRHANSFATDSLQFHGLASRAGEAPVGLMADLPGRRLQHEHSMVIIRDAAIHLDPGASVTAGFFGSYVPDHPEATSSSDLQRISELVALPEAVPIEVAVEGDSGSADSSGTQTLLSSAPLLNALELDAETLRGLFGSQWRHEELDEQGAPLSFFYGCDRHVVLRAKELRVRRPHGHVLRTGLHMTPDESALTSTVWMSGVFHSMLTQGHVSINRLLSTVHSYLGLFRSHGQRVFVEIGGSWRLLNVPSAFEMSPDGCRWIYRHERGVIQVRSEARSEPHELRLSIEISSGEPARFLLSHHVALNGDDGSTPGAAHWLHLEDGIVLAPAPATEIARRFPNGSFHIAPISGTSFEEVGGDELLFIDGCSRQQPFVCIITAAARVVGVRIRGYLVPEAIQTPLRLPGGVSLIPRLDMTAPPGSPLCQQIARIADIVPWFTHNALVHYLSPRGLEQYSGGGWGTRDVCQGPVEMLLALGRIEPMRDLLLRVMTAQNVDGDWPQWFMFFERERDIRAGDSHGDIVFWPLLVLAQYLIASGDAGVLDELVPFFDSRSADAGECATVWQHAQRALSLIEMRVIPGTALAAYGHGDWNDALQPADPRMREHMCSAWTVTLHFQMLSSLARALRACGRFHEAIRLESSAQGVQRDFRRLLLVDGVLAGYALFEQGGGVRYLLHPSDQSSGVRYSALAIIHAILEDMLTPAQAREHLRLIDVHLSAADGLRLFDRPMPYHGGPMRLFQRAETATFFGREIGLMYLHAHLRYAQALAHMGEPDRFFHALCQANPIGIRAIVPTATLRQANCYYSSSDAAFEDRYQASAEYERVALGSIALDGGWRVYSSGAGIALGLIVRHFLGVSCESEVLRIDPVMPSALDGLRVQMQLRGRAIEVRYRVGAAGCGVNGVVLNDQSLPFRCEANPHRRGAALVAMAAMLEQLAAAAHCILIIDLG